MPLLDRDCATYCRQLYHYPQDPQATFDYEDDGIQDGVPWAARWSLEDDGCLDICFAGTETSLELLRDFTAIPMLVDGLGAVHMGFYRNLHKPIKQTIAMKPKRVRITGHSYGAAHARLFARMLDLFGIVPYSPPVLFGEPASGFDPSPARSYALPKDPIPLLPPPPWMQGSQLIFVNADITDTDALASHHIWNYEKALANINTSTP